MMRKKLYIPVIYTVLIFLMIFSFHSYQNLKSISASPSEKWGRDFYIDKTPYKKPASIGMGKENIYIITAKEDRFTKTILEKDKGAVKETQDIIIPGAALNKLVKYKSIEPYIFWTENYDLFMSKKLGDNQYEEKKLILAGVKDFNIFSQNGEIDIAAAYDSGLRYYKINDMGLKPWGEAYPFNKPLLVSAAIDDAGSFHTVSIRDISPMEKEIIYLIFSAEGQWTQKAQKKEFAQVSNESVGNLEIGLDRDYAYIFYENNVWNNFGQTARTLYTAVSLDDGGSLDMTFRMLNPEGPESSTDAYVSEVKCPDYKKDRLEAVFIEKYWDEASEGFRVLNVGLAGGKLSDITVSTRMFEWIKGIDIAQYGEDQALVFLKTAGGFKNDVWFTQTGEGYKASMKKPAKNDYIIAMQNSIAPYINGLVIAMIRAFIFFPAVLWLLIVEFFEIRRFLFNPKLNYTITIGIYIILKLLTANFYYNGLSYYLVPGFMKPMIIRYLIMAVISGVSYYIAKLYKKSIRDLHIIPEFFLFMLHDLLITVFLYGPYIT